MKTPERRHWRCSGVFIVNFEHISYLALVFLTLVEPMVKFDFGGNGYHV